MNALVEKSALKQLSGEIRNFHFPDTYHTAYFCPDCATYVWSEYRSGRFDDCWFVRVGTLDEPDRMPPDVHIFTESRQSWVDLPLQALSFERFYKIRDVWPKSSIARLEAYRDKPG